MKHVNPEYIREECNNIYSNRESHYQKHYSKSHYFTLWDRIIRQTDSGENVCDVGCGPGQFMEMALDRKVAKYIGIDISSAAIGRACELLSERKDADKVTLVCTNVLADDYVLPRADAYVMSEILEHIHQDDLLISKVPIGKKVILSVPNYLGGSHVRKFDTIEEVKARYENFMEIEHEDVILMGDQGGKIFILKGTRAYKIP